MVCLELGMYMRTLIFVVLLVSSAAVFCSCKKKTAEAQAPAQTAETTPAPATAPAPAPDPAALTAAPPQPVPVINTTAAIADVNQAMKARDYKKAATTLIAVQQQPLTPEQAAAVHGQMVQLQGALAGAVASGDPAAKAAADALRASTMH